MPLLSDTSKQHIPLKSVFILILLLTSFEYAQNAILQIPNPETNYRSIKTILQPNIAIASDNAAIYYLDTKGRYTSRNIDTLKINWEIEIGGEVIADPKVFGEYIIIIVKAEDDVFIRSLDKTSGLTRWQSTIPITDTTETLNDNNKTTIKAFVSFYDAGNSVIFVSGEGLMCAFENTVGRVLWKRFTSGRLSAEPLIGDDNVFLGFLDGQITVSSLRDGRTVKSFALTTTPTVFVQQNSKFYLIAGDRAGRILYLNLRSGEIFKRFLCGGEVSSITETPSGVLITSFDNFVYLLSESGSRLIWKKRLAGRITADPLIRGRYLTLISVESPAVIVCDLNSGKLLYRILIEPDNFFTGQSVPAGLWLVYASQTGIFIFSLPT